MKVQKCSVKFSLFYFNFFNMENWIEINLQISVKGQYRQAAKK
jgi:hypothetical protein